jgi:hypothetical protein
LDRERRAADAQALSNGFDGRIHGPFSAGGLVDRGGSEFAEALDEFSGRPLERRLDVNHVCALLSRNNGLLSTWDSRRVDLR